MGKYDDWLNRWGADSERLHRIGVHPYCYDPGFACSMEGVRGQIDIPTPLAKIICNLVKQVYPETKDDKKMIAAYRLRMKENYKQRTKESLPPPTG